MGTVSLTIDGIDVQAKEGMTILDAARTVGIDVPTLCHHQDLTLYGSCRLCTVEITKGQRTRLVASCVYPVEEGLVVKTESERVAKTRKLILEFLLARAPGVQILRQYGAKYGVDAKRFAANPTFCILCGLCVRYCAEVKKKNAIGFVGRGADLDVMFMPGVASRECPDCWECVSICPTGVIPSNYALAQVPRLVFPTVLGK